MMDFLLFCFQSSSRLAENLDRNNFSYSFRLSACQLSDDWMDLVSYLTLFSFIRGPLFVRRGFSSRLIETTFFNKAMDLNGMAISWWSAEWKSHHSVEDAIEMWYAWYRSLFCLPDCAMNETSIERFELFGLKIHEAAKLFTLLIWISISLIDVLSKENVTCKTFWIWFRMCCNLELHAWVYSRDLNPSASYWSEREGWRWKMFWLSVASLRWCN